MYKILLIIGTILITSACKSSKVSCDAYADNDTTKKRKHKIIQRPLFLNSNLL